MMGLRTRKIAGSGCPVVAETISAPTSSQASAMRATSASQALPPRPRTRARRPASSACESWGTESCSFDCVPAPFPESGIAAILCNSTRRPPTATPAPPAPHSKVTCCVRSTVSASHSSNERSSVLLEEGPVPAPAAICPGTTRQSATPRVRRRTRRCWASWRDFCSLARSAATSRRFSARAARLGGTRVVMAAPRVASGAGVVGCADRLPGLRQGRLCRKAA
mmetsp:Transcript_7066/g.20092  ORF Transcript_7066/g.20092 Transcript_7066/m.20092 type:complete len:223 (-) Transcript_7066:23-691(-)